MNPDLFKFRYVVALVLVATIALVGFLSTQYASWDSDEFAGYINESGRQRMLSQRMVALSFDASTTGNSPNVLENLIETAQTFERAHTMLVDVAGRYPEIETVYSQAPNRLDDRSRSIIDLVEMALRDQNVTADEAAEIAQYGYRILPHLNQAVARFEWQSRQRYELANKVEISAFVALWGILILLYFLLFKPTSNALENTLSDLENAAASAERASRARADFIANMSHEIRTPLHGILGVAALIEEDQEISSRTREQLGHVQSSGKGLMRLVNDILDMSKIDAGLMEFEQSEINLQSVLRDVLNEFKPECASKGVQLALNMPPSAPEMIRIDGHRLAQIVRNLVSNAVKFTSHGIISVEVKIENGSLLVFVTDTGPGIPQTNLEAVFERFKQSDMTLSRVHGGTGLGLPIVKEIVTLMGGNIGVESTVGQGSRFWFRVPFENVLETSQGTSGVSSSPADVVSLEGHRILVVDDVATNRLVCSALLKSLGAEVVEADGGEKAIELLENEPFAAALIDLHMPKISGDQVIAFTRQSDGPNANIPLIVLTADIGTKANHLVRNAGADNLATKPFNKNKLAAMLHGYLTQEASGG